MQMFISISVFIMQMFITMSVFIVQMFITMSVFIVQMLASIKQQFVELLSDIGFVQEGISSRDVERAARGGGDGVAKVTGDEVSF